MNCQTLRTSELEVVIGNNQQGSDDHKAHRSGYNGIWSLTSIHSKTNCFLPNYAGLNLEHLMDGLFATEKGGDWLEPRNSPMQLERISDNAVMMTQTNTPLTHVDSMTIFEVKEPHIIDFSFTARFNSPVRQGKQFGFFWASYINAPDSPELYFVDRDMYWNCLSPDKHGKGGANTVCHSSIVEPSFGSSTATTLAHSFSDRRFHIPLMFGRPGDGRMLFLQMFDQTSSIRLTMSPSGGGRNDDLKLFNPAWDYQFIIDEAEVGVEYRMSSRVIYKPYVCRSEVLDLFNEWNSSTRASVFASTPWTPRCTASPPITAASRRKSP